MNNQTKPQLLVWWILWASFLIGVCQVYYFLGVAGEGAKQTLGAAQAPTLAASGLLPVAISALIRWNVLPQIQSRHTALCLFIAGMALAEASCFVGLFVFPAYKEVFFAFSVLGIFQFIPFFARRYFTETE